MRNLSLFIFSSLIAFIFNDACTPAYLSGVDSLSKCSNLSIISPEYNECCMITYTDENSDTYKVCYEMSAKIIIHYEQYIQLIKNDIQGFYPNSPRVKSIDYYVCSSNYLKVSLFALFLILF